MPSLAKKATAKVKLVVESLGTQMGLIKLYDDDFFKGHDEYFPAGAQLGRTIAQRYQVGSIVDFGCGVGCYLEGFRQEGAKVKGFELSLESAKKYSQEAIIPFISAQDITRPIECGKFQVAMSTEVAEHIPTSKSDVLVGNLTNASEQWIFFTAAPPGQGGVGHINEQPPEFWIEKFKKKNFDFSEPMTEEIKQICRDTAGIAWYITDNFMVFEKSQ